MAFPKLSLSDPKVGAEGGIDPLGLAVIGERLAQDMAPGITQRMSRPRFITAVCVGALLSEEIEARRATPTHIAFEWIVVLSLAALDEAVRRVPGVQKARNALHAGLPLTPARYLKSATIFGFHGVYKTAAVALGLVDDDLRLRPAGGELLGAWEQAMGLPGFQSNDARKEGGKLRAKIQAAVVTALAAEGAEAPPRALMEELQRVFRPDRISKGEAGVLRSLLLHPSGGTRGELLMLLARPDVQKQLGTAQERALLSGLQRWATPELQATLRAIEAFEAVARPLHDAFDRVRVASTHEPSKPVNVAELASTTPGVAAVTRNALLDLPQHLEARTAFQRAATTIADFDDVVDDADLYRAVLRRHERAQRDKPPAGKRPWFERAADGRIVIRPLYSLESMTAPPDSAVFPYRIAPLASFLADLDGASA